MARGVASVGTRIRRTVTSAAALAVASAVLAACGGGKSGGPVSISYYGPPDFSGSVQQGIDYCDKNANGAYKIKYFKLPTSADGQRTQLVRRMAAHDSSVDLMGLDVTWPPEFSEAGWAEPWTGKHEQTAKADQIAGPLKTATWRGKLVAIPYNSNVQLLWYRKDLLPNLPQHVTWDQMISMAKDLASRGKPHYIEEQGAQYEGATVWFNSVIESAGGSVLNAHSTAPSLGAPAKRALQIMRNVATSVAADPSLPNMMEDQGRLAMEAGHAAFEVNYPFVWASMQADKPTVRQNGRTIQIYKNFDWRPYPGVNQGEPGRSTIGGIDIAVSSFSRHQDLAFQAAACMASKPNQLVNATVGGLPPTLKSIYLSPTAKFKQTYPFYKIVYDQMQKAAIRPQTPAYQTVSIAISHTVSPPAQINPASDVDSMHSLISDYLASKGLVP